MTVKEFVNKCEKTTDLEKTIKEIVTVKYIPYAEKIALGEKILKHTCYTNTEPNLFKINSPAKKMFLLLSFVDRYTTIDIDWSNALDEFDALSETALIGAIMNEIEPSEIQLCSSIVEMMLDDIIMNERDLVSYLETKVESAKLAFNALSSALTPEMINELMSKINE